MRLEIKSRIDRKKRLELLEEPSMHLIVTLRRKKRIEEIRA